MTVEVAVVGGGIVGLATAMRLAEGGTSVAVLEAEDHVAAHQSGHNSGVVHSGLYYRPGSLKARLCAEGREAMIAFCADEGVPVARSGKLVVATTPEERPRLAELARRGRANGLAGLRELGPDDIAAFEPHAQGVAGLHVPETAVTDYRRVAAAMARRVLSAGAEIRLGAGVRGIVGRPGALRLLTVAGDLEARVLVACAGLQADRVAREGGLDPDVRIVPFRGEYRELTPEAAGLVNGLIYPVPDPRLPFLGVHLTRGVDGRVEAGPNAVLALSRHGYKWDDLSLRDLVEELTWPGSWRLFRTHAGSGLREVARSLYKPLFAAAVARLVPELTPDQLLSGPTGVRAQAVDIHGRLVDDFRFAEAPGQIHVLNAPSPAATASLAIADVLAGKARQALAGI